MKKMFRMLAVLLLLCFLGACGAKQPPSVSRSSFLLDTSIQLTLYDWTEEDTLTRAMEEITRLERLLSVEKEGSDLDRLCKAAGQSWVDISPECEAVLRRAKEVWALSEGHFDVTAGPLIDLWSIGSDGEGHYPTKEEREAAQVKISSEKLLVEEGRAFLTEEGMKANLGAIAKGYIADELKRFLVEEGVEHALIDLGRNLLLVGAKPDGSAFHIGVQSPFEEGGIWKTLTLSDHSVVTAGIDERFFEQDGKRYHHILDPFSGFPAETGIASVTIISQESVLGDALSTTCLLLGEKKGMALIERLPDVEALFILQNQEERMSSGFSSYVATD